MLLLGLFLYPLILGASGDLSMDDYVTDIETDALPIFLTSERLSDALNAPELGDRHIVQALFDSVAGIKILNPTDSFLIVLPQSVSWIFKNLDLPSRTDNGTTENSSRTYADLTDLESPEVTENLVESSTLRKFNRSGEPIDSSIGNCLEKMYTKLLDNQFRRVNERRMEIEEER